MLSGKDNCRARSYFICIPSRHPFQNIDWRRSDLETSNSPSSRVSRSLGTGSRIRGNRHMNTPLNSLVKHFGTDYRWRRTYHQSYFQRSVAISQDWAWEGIIPKCVASVCLQLFHDHSHSAEQVNQEFSVSLGLGLKATQLG